MHLPVINYAKKGALSLDFNAFMDALQERAVCFRYLKKPARGQQFSNGVKTAYGTLNHEYIQQRYTFKNTTVVRFKDGLISYWDFDHERTSAKGNGWGGFYVDRWMGWYPEASVSLEEADEEEEFESL